MLIKRHFLLIIIIAYYIFASSCKTLDSSSELFSAANFSACPVQNRPSAPFFHDENRRAVDANYYSKGYTVVLAYSLETDPRFVSNIPFRVRDRAGNQRLAEQHVREYTDRLTAITEEKLTEFFTNFSLAYFTSLSYLAKNWSTVLTNREAPFLQVVILVDGRTMYRQIVVDVAQRGVRVSAPRAAAGGLGHRIAMRELNRTIANTSATVQREMSGGSDAAVGAVTQIGLRDDAVRFRFLDNSAASNTLLRNIFGDTTEGVKVAVVSPTGRVLRNWSHPIGKDMKTAAFEPGSLMSDLTYNVTVRDSDCLYADADGDGVPDREDFCPNSQNIEGIQRQLGSNRNGCGHDPGVPVTPKDDVVGTPPPTDGQGTKPRTNVNDALCMCGLWTTTHGRVCAVVRPKNRQTSNANGKFWVLTRSNAAQFCGDRNRCLANYRAYLNNRNYCPNGWQFQNE
jgi:hypothetical protein